MTWRRAARPRTSPRAAAAILSMAAGLCGAGVAFAHGGVPVSTQILWRGQTLLVPTQYWGIFVGAEGSPWRWICDEAINDYKLRSVFAGGDGALYATALTGLSVSRDGGCDWQPLGGAIDQLEVDAVAADPLVGDRLWVTTNQRDGQGMPVARLWAGERLGDAKQATWRSAYSQTGAFARGLVVSSDGKGIHLLTAALGAQQAPQLVISADGGGTFKAITLGALPATSPDPTVTLLQSDFSAAHGVYLRLMGDSEQVLALASATSGSATELLRLPSPIFAVTLDAPRGRALIATAAGLFTLSGAGPPQKSAGLGRAQCAEVHDSAVYACSWNYFPDNAAVARSLDALAGQPFETAPRRLFQYADTVGVVSCPAGTAVARICPALWAQNAPLLGITADMGGGDMGSPGPAPGSCQAAPGRLERSQDRSPAGLAGAALALLGLALRRPGALSRLRSRSRGGLIA